MIFCLGHLKWILCLTSASSSIHLTSAFYWSCCQTRTYELWHWFLPSFSTFTEFLPPALAEEVIFSVASVCLSVCVSVCLRSTGWTVGPTGLKFGARIKNHHISDGFEGQGHRSKVKVTKVKNVKTPVFSLVSEKVVQGQGHKGQGQGHKGQSCLGTFVPPSTRGRCDTRAFSFNSWSGPKWKRVTHTVHQNQFTVWSNFQHREHKTLFHST